jgi:hypothetical protein
MLDTIGNSDGIPSTVKNITEHTPTTNNFPQANISVLILGQAHKPQNRRLFRINYELILSEIMFLYS